MARVAGISLLFPAPHQDNVIIFVSLRGFAALRLCVNFLTGKLFFTHITSAKRVVSCCDEDNLHGLGDVGDLPRLATGRRRGRTGAVRSREKVDLEAIKATDAKLSPGAAGLTVSTGRKNNWPGILLTAPAGIGTFRRVVLWRWRSRIRAAIWRPFPARGQSGADAPRIASPVRSRSRPVNGKSSKCRCSQSCRRSLAINCSACGDCPLVGRGEGDRSGQRHATVDLCDEADRAAPLRDRRITAGGDRPALPPLNPAKLFPLIDSFGQYRHADWPGKTHSADDFRAQRQPRRPIWPLMPARKAGTSTAAGRPGRNGRPAVSFMWKRSTASGGWSTPRAGCSGRTGSTASIRQRSHSDHRPRALVRRSAGKNSPDSAFRPF